MNVASSYSDDQVLIATVDADKNSELRKYLQGGYPTVRVFSKGKVGDKSFVGNKPESFIRNFLDGITTSQKRGKLIELKTAAEFDALVKDSQIPVMVKFSASW